jgi:hypothetical protein
MALINASALPPLLSAINSASIKLTMLMDTKGSLLGCAGETIVDTHGKEVAREAIAAIVSNIWSDFASSSGNQGDGMTKQTEDVSSAGVGQPLRFMEMELQVGRVAVSRVCGDFLVCCITDAAAETGLVKVKLQKLSASLAAELSKLSL